MATYLEIFDIQNDNDLQHKISTAVAVAAETIRTELGSVTNHANRLLWAKDAFSDPIGESKKVLWAVLAANSSASTAAILGASDAVIQSNVDAVIDVFATGA